MSMAKEDRIREAWREARNRKWAFPDMATGTAWAEVRLRLAREEEVA